MAGVAPNGDQDAGKSLVGRSRGPTWGKYRTTRVGRWSTADAKSVQEAASVCEYGGNPGPPATLEHLKWPMLPGSSASDRAVAGQRAVSRSEGGLAIMVVMTSRTMFEDAEDRRERGFASFPVYIEDRVVDRDLVREDGACVTTR